MNEVVPTISIITPCYNCEDFLSDCFASVEAQSFKDFEWIIVDDCSTDDSPNILKRFQNQDPRIKLLMLDKNGGSGKARNKALDIARGKYVTFLDADDFLDPNYLESQLSFIKENGPIISAGYRRMAPSTVTDFFVPSLVDYKKILKGNPMSCLTTMYDREFFPDHRFPENLARQEDYAFWASMLKKGAVCRGNQKVLATYRIRKASKNGSKIKLVIPTIKTFHKGFGFSYFRSVFYTARYALYSKKKYRGVK